jgi:hypothetical protein
MDSDGGDARRRFGATRHIGMSFEVLPMLAPVAHREAGRF